MQVFKNIFNFSRPKISGQSDQRYETQFDTYPEICSVRVQLLPDSKQIELNLYWKSVCEKHKQSKLQIARYFNTHAHLAFLCGNNVKPQIIGNKNDLLTFMSMSMCMCYTVRIGGICCSSGKIIIVWCLFSFLFHFFMATVTKYYGDFNWIIHDWKSIFLYSIQWVTGK